MSSATAPEPDRSCCATGHLDSGTPTGSTTTIGGVPTYVARVEGSGGTRAIVILTDVFGWELVNSRLLADKYAAATGINTYVPDLCSGDALTAEKWDPVMAPPPGFFNRAVGGVRFMCSLPTLLSWFGKHDDKVTMPILQKFLEGLKGQGSQAIGTMGYCWGGRFSLLCGGTGPVADHVRAVACAHPSWTKVPEDIQALTKPTFIGAAETDGIFPKAAVENTRKIFAEKKGKDPKLALELREYPGTKHGFAVRGDEKDEKVAQARAEVLQHTADFFKAHLVV